MKTAQSLYLLCYLIADPNVRRCESFGCDSCGGLSKCNKSFCPNTALFDGCFKLSVLKCTPLKRISVYEAQSSYISNFFYCYFRMCVKSRLAPKVARDVLETVTVMMLAWSAMDLKSSAMDLKSSPDNLFHQFISSCKGLNGLKLQKLRKYLKYLIRLVMCPTELLLETQVKVRSTWFVHVCLLVWFGLVC